MLPIPRPPRAPRPAPLPSLIEEFSIPHPALPATLDGLSILHLSDLHIRRFTPRNPRFLDLLHALDALAHRPEGPPDLIAFTGDLMDAPGHEHATITTLRALAPRLASRLGVFCIFGNHDTPALRAAIARAPIPPFSFLNNSSLRVSPDLTILGLSYPEDPLAAILHAAPPDTSLPFSAPFTLTLAHHPTCLIACADLGLPLVLAGHTHAGQVRVSSRLAPHTSSDIPADLATGTLRLRSTLMCISRGLGDGVIDGLRLNCPPQIPLYTLRRADLPSIPAGGHAAAVSQVMAW